MSVKRSKWYLGTPDNQGQAQTTVGENLVHRFPQPFMLGITYVNVHYDPQSLGSPLPLAVHAETRRTAKNGPLRPSGWLRV